MKRQRSRQRGASLIEFVICAFTLLLVSFAGIEMDRLLFVYSNVTDAAKAGMRYAITHGNNKTVGACSQSDHTDVDNLVKSYLAGIDKSRTAPDFVVDVSYPNTTNATGDPVKVVIRYKYDPWIQVPGLSGIWIGAAARGIITY
jgi:Flp pilus assembly protein TadG